MKNLEEGENFIKDKDVFSNLYNKQDNGPFFVIISSKNNTKFNDLEINKELMANNINGIQKIEKINFHNIKVTFNTFHQANNLTLCNTINKDNKNIYIPRNILEKRGIIEDIPNSFSLKELAEGLSSTSPVIKIQRIIINNKQYNKDLPDSINNNKKHATDKILITFRAQSLPEEVKIFHTLRKVKITRINIKFCGDCLRFGHRSSVQFPCRNKKICYKCGKDHLPTETCSDYCYMCKENHKINSQECKQREIQKNLNIEVAYNNKLFMELRNTKKNQYDSNYYGLLSTKEFPELPSTQRQTSQNFSFNKIDDRLVEARKVTTKDKQNIQPFNEIIKEAQQYYSDNKQFYANKQAHFDHKQYIKQTNEEVLNTVKERIRKRKMEEEAKKIKTNTNKTTENMETETSEQPNITTNIQSIEIDREDDNINIDKDDNMNSRQNSRNSFL
ncbi:CLUMA_CG000357, isoform A [Clunio marinus]|uniref:CLUMA_CG000357, isoform A n=1 Tax=Clunio marinus TaxID=568069 RepID=A0A1J1HJE9_9DIPT|nr:CLUMA_CG000357, isoform A [Clunio marinus]